MASRNTMKKRKLVRTNPFIVAHNCIDKRYGNREDVITDLLVSMISLDPEVGLELMRFMTGVDLPPDTPIFAKAQPEEISATGDNPDILLTAPDAGLSLFIEAKVDSGQSPKAGDDRTQLRRYLDQVEAMNRQGRTLLAYLVRDTTSNVDSTVTSSPLFVKPAERPCFTWQDVLEIVHSLAARRSRNSMEHRLAAQFAAFLESACLASGHVAAPWTGLLEDTLNDERYQLRRKFGDLLRRAQLDWLGRYGFQDGTESGGRFEWLHMLYMRPPKVGPLSEATGVTYMVFAPSAGYDRRRPSELVPPCFEIRLHYNSSGEGLAQTVAEAAEQALPDGVEYLHVVKQSRCAWWTELNPLLEASDPAAAIRSISEAILEPLLNVDRNGDGPA